MSVVISQPDHHGDYGRGGRQHWANWIRPKQTHLNPQFRKCSNATCVEWSSPGAPRVLWLLAQARRWSCDGDDGEKYFLPWLHCSQSHNLSVYKVATVHNITFSVFIKLLLHPSAGTHQLFTSSVSAIPQMGKSIERRKLDRLFDGNVDRYVDSFDLDMKDFIKMSILCRDSLQKYQKFSTKLRRVSLFVSTGTNVVNISLKVKNLCI